LLLFTKAFKGEKATALVQAEGAAPFLRTLAIIG
jgi:hypothetical protein